VTVLDSRTQAAPAQAANPAAAAIARDPEVRLAALFDAGTLHLLTPHDASGALAATGRIDGMPAVAFASDPRVQGGATGSAGCAAIVAAYDEAMAMELAGYAPVLVEGALADRVEALLVARCRDLLGLARRAGEAQMGFVKVERLLASGEAGLLLAARDGAADGRGKLAARAGGLRERALLGTAELGAAFGRDAAVHAALRRGALALALARELDRLEGFRPEARSESRGQRRDGSRGLFRNDVAISERE